MKGEKVESDTEPEKKKPKKSTPTPEPKSPTPTRKKSPARSQSTTDDGPAAGKAQNMDSGSSSSRIRPSIVPADSTSLATILPQASGIPATTAKLGFLGLGIMGKIKFHSETSHCSFRWCYGNEFTPHRP